MRVTQLVDSLSHISTTEEDSSPLLSVSETFLIGANKNGRRGAQGILWLACKESTLFCTGALHAAGVTVGDGGSKGVLYLT